VARSGWLGLRDARREACVERAGLIAGYLLWLAGGVALVLVLMAAIGSLHPILRKRAFVSHTLRPKTRFILLALQKRYLQAGDKARAQGRAFKAARLYQRALVLGGLVYGPEHPIVVLTMERCAAVLRAAQREAEAAALESRARAIRAGHRSDPGPPGGE
jgi:tetratricopeptide repeat protein